MAKKAIEIIDNKAITEFSGNVSLDNIEDVGKIGSGLCVNRRTYSLLIRYLI